MKIAEALEKGCTAYTKQVRSPYSCGMTRVTANKKMGGGDNFITVGEWKDREMFQVSLEERATCPDSCPFKHQGGCYGDNMPFATRLSHDEPEMLLTRLELDLFRYRNACRPPVVRLHVLGDFFSVGYAKFWVEAARSNKCAVFGFTAHQPDSEIGRVLNAGRWVDGFRMRFSHYLGPCGALVAGVTPAWDTVESVRCPHEIYGIHCKDCGLCWETETPILFTYHGQKTYQKAAQVIAAELKESNHE